MILPILFIDSSPSMGRGVFTSEPIEAGTLIEISPVIVMSGEERKLLDQTLMHDYIFEWGIGSTQCCVALGYLSMYNHSYTANCEYEMDFDLAIMQVRTVRPVPPGEELCINYNGEWNNNKELWFDAK